MHPEPVALLRFLLRGSQDRFPLVAEDLLDLPKEPGIVPEGFGFTPNLLWPALSRKRQAVWLVPTEDFKRASMERHNKPSSQGQGERSRESDNEPLSSRYDAGRGGHFSGCIPRPDGIRG